MSNKLKQFFNDPNGRSAVVGALCFGSGIAVGWWLTRQPVKVIHPNENKPVTKVVIDEEVFVAKANEPKVVPIEIIDEDEIDPVTIDEEPVLRSIFAASDDDWDNDAELAARKPSVPYIIHKDEFFANEMEFRQTTLSYYKDDHTLCDETDGSPIYNVDHVVGELKFGHGSGDPNVVYIRNEKLRGEYEVLLVDGSYQIMVQGLEPEEEGERSKILEHSQVKRFRPE